MKNILGKYLGKYLFLQTELRHKIIENLRLKTGNYWWFKISMIIWCNNGISKTHKFVRHYTKSTN